MSGSPEKSISTIKVALERSGFGSVDHLPPYFIRWVFSHLDDVLSFPYLFHFIKNMIKNTIKVQSPNIEAFWQDLFKEAHFRFDVEKHMTTTPLVMPHIEALAAQSATMVSSVPFTSFMDDFQWLFISTTVAAAKAPGGPLDSTRKIPTNPIADMTAIATATTIATTNATTTMAAAVSVVPAAVAPTSPFSDDDWSAVVVAATMAESGRKRPHDESHDDDKDAEVTNDTEHAFKKQKNLDDSSDDA